MFVRLSPSTSHVAALTPPVLTLKPAGRISVQPMLPRRPFPSIANLRPMLPKQTLLQNRTLAIQVLTAIVSLLTSLVPQLKLCCDTSMTGMACARGDGAGGAGTILGLMPRSTAVPVIPTMADRRKPGFDRSIRYQSAGLTMASVKDTCKVDCQGSLRCKLLVRICSSSPRESPNGQDLRSQKQFQQKPRYFAQLGSNLLQGRFRSLYWASRLLRLCFYPAPTSP